MIVMMMIMLSSLFFDFDLDTFSPLHPWRIFFVVLLAGASAAAAEIMQIDQGLYGVAAR